MKMITADYADSPTGIISATRNQRFLRSVGSLCCHKLTQHRNDFLKIVICMHACMK
jgi:hypothetical protein